METTPSENTVKETPTPQKALQARGKSPTQQPNTKKESPPPQTKKKPRIQVAKSRTPSPKRRNPSPLRRKPSPMRRTQVAGTHSYPKAIRTLRTDEQMKVLKEVEEYYNNMRTKKQEATDAKVAITVDSEYLNQKDSQIKDLTSSVHALHTRNAVLETEYNNLAQQNQMTTTVAANLTNLQAEIQQLKSQTTRAKRARRHRINKKFNSYPPRDNISNYTISSDDDLETQQIAEETYSEELHTAPDQYTVHNTTVYENQEEIYPEELRTVPEQYTAHNTTVHNTTVHEAQEQIPITKDDLVLDIKSCKVQLALQAMRLNMKPEDLPDMDDLINLGYGLTTSREPQKQQPPPRRQKMDTRQRLHKRAREGKRQHYTTQDSLTDYPYQSPHSVSCNITSLTQLQIPKIVSSPQNPVEIDIRPQKTIPQNHVMPPRFGESLPYITITSGSRPYTGVPLLSLKDSGSSHTLMSKAVFLGHLTYRKAKTHKVHTRILMADQKQALMCTEYAELYLTFKSTTNRLITFLHPVFIVDGMSEQFFIGHDITGTNRKVYETPDHIALANDVHLPNKFVHLDKDPNIFIVPIAKQGPKYGPQYQSTKMHHIAPLHIKGILPTNDPMFGLPT